MSNTLWAIYVGVSVWVALGLLSWWFVRQSARLGQRYDHAMGAERDDNVEDSGDAL